MNQHMLRACAAAVAMALSGQASALTLEDPLLQARIAVSWNAPVQDLAKLLAERMAMPYFDGSGGSAVTVVLDQGEQSTVSQTIEAINKQINAHGLSLDLTQGTDGQRLELSRAHAMTAVVEVAVGDHATPTIVAPAVHATSTPGPALTAAPVAAAAADNGMRVWTISPSDRLVRHAFERWAKESDFEIIWSVPKDIVIEASAKIDGTFEIAIQTVLESISESEYPVEAISYDNKVIRIVKTAQSASSK